MPQTNDLDGIAALTFPHATAALRKGLAAIASGKTVFDLASVQTVDSSAVAVLLEWKRAAARAGAALTYVNLPASLQSLATLYGVDEFLIESPANLHHH
jgi:phospholipid transport system transporter-binding protein